VITDVIAQLLLPCMTCMTATTGMDHPRTMLMVHTSGCGVRGNMAITCHFDICRCEMRGGTGHQSLADGLTLVWQSFIAQSIATTPAALII